MKTNSLIGKALCLTLILFASSATFAKDKDDDKDDKKKSSSHSKKPSHGPPKRPSAPPASRRPTSPPPSVKKPQAPSGGPSHRAPQHAPPRVVPHAVPRVTVAPPRPPVVVGVRRPSGPVVSHGTQTVGVSASSVQRALAARGFYRGSIDGVVGPMTRNAIASFQASAGLPVTGQVSSSLLHALQR